MSQKVVFEFERLHVQVALGMLKKISAPNAFLLGKLQKQIESFLSSFPNAGKFRLTAEAVDEEKPVEADREASEEMAR
jgi:hypothetical protein